MGVKLKICGLTRVPDVNACVAEGVEALGINLWPGSKRHVSLEDAMELRAAIPAGTHAVGVFVNPSPEELVRAARALSLDFVQLHGDSDASRFPPLPCPWVRVIRGNPDLQSIPRPMPTPEWVIVDAATPNFGGAGQRGDWDFAREAVAAMAPTPVWLAGGITVDNAVDAIGRVGPAGLDVASGAEFPGAKRGEKDPARIAALARICHNRGEP